MRGIDRSTRTDLLHAAARMCAITRRRSRVPAALLLTLVAAGCASNQPSFDPLGPQPPSDFSVDASVVVGRNATEQVGVHRRQGRHILFADGGLHSDVGPSLTPDVRPAETRQLTTAQVESVWRLAQSLGLTDPEKGSRPINDTLLKPGDGEIVTVATFTGGDDRWQFIWRNGFREPTDPAAAALVRELAGLAWMTDTPPNQSMAPIRYDLGTDPYARYRQMGPPAPATPSGGSGGSATSRSTTPSATPPPRGSARPPAPPSLDAPDVSPPATTQPQGSGGGSTPASGEATSVHPSATATRSRPGAGR